MTVSHSSSTNSPSGTGLRRPLSSGSPSIIFSTFMPRTVPSPSTRISTGACRKKKSMPSSFACRSSSMRAGASASERRYTQRTVGVPSRLATRRQSIAVLPAPITTTLLPIVIGVSR